MLLHRIGRKNKIAQEIIKHFPQHDIYIELFFGAGGIFFSKKPAAKYNILNDLDNDVFNLFMILKEQPQALYDRFASIPFHTSIFKQFKNNAESDPLWRACRFLYLSNLGYMGKNDNMSLESVTNNKKITLNNILLTYQILNNANLQFLNFDFRDVLKKIGFRRGLNKKKTFIYADPPYCNCRNNYNTFKKLDTIELFETLIDSEIRFAISEFDSDFIDDLICKYKLNKIFIINRRNLTSKEKKIEILITNYSNDSLFNI